MKDLVTKLGEMTGRCPIWLFFTSRPDGPVGNFTLGTKRNLRQPRHDIEIFITKQLELLPKSFSKFHTDIRQGILGRAGGTFLWIHIVLKEIRKLKFPNKKSVRQVIEKTPWELDELYTELFRDVSREKHATAILAWVTYAKRPLSLRELETAVAVMVTNSDKWADCLEEMVSLDAELIEEMLGTLVDVIDGELFLIHQSLLDFLKSRPEIWQEGNLELQLPQPDLELGRTCMRFLSFGDITIPGDDISAEGHYSDAQEVDFLQYVLIFWHEHIESINDVKDDIDILKRAVQGLIGNPYRPGLACTYGSFMLYVKSQPSIFDLCLRFDIGWLASGLADPSIPELSYNFSKHDLARAARGPPNVLNHLLKDGFQITPEVVIAAAASVVSWNLKLLLETRGDEIQTTPEVVVEAAASECFGWKGTLELLLETRGDEIQITPEVVIAAAGGRDFRNLQLLLEKRGGEIQIIPEMVIAAAGGRNSRNLQLLLEKRGDEVQITPEVYMAAAGHLEREQRLGLLMEKRGDEIQKITPEMERAAAKRFSENLKLLITQKLPRFGL
uniref:GPI inositol-deacylase winged helix domain-containing protein n=1 Tax=Bionectria ochroleuca TaxID=29856 RepID=A0A8H7TVA4_BIOOC